MSAVEALESAAVRLMNAVDDTLDAMHELEAVSPRLSGEAHHAACELADVHNAVKRAREALAGAGA